MKKIVGLILCLLVIAIGIAVYSVLPARAIKGEAYSHPNVLTNASEQQIKQTALDFVKQNFSIRSGTPVVKLARAVTKASLPGLNLPSIPHTTIEEPPLMLVIIKGDFGPANLPGASAQLTDQKYEYVGLVLDLWAGFSILTMASTHGGEFRTALGDLTLPIVETPVPAPLSESSAPKYHYGEVVPTASDPTTAP
jgi:hypothetical protein